jgi:hypothetical protein
MQTADPLTKPFPFNVFIFHFDKPQENPSCIFQPTVACTTVGNSKKIVGKT